ncbi:MAG: hypothetical protein JWP35_4175 [Caulobacter sp.]|nr:hypothetical protein [Caulobacter sp.]
MSTRQHRPTRIGLAGAIALLVALAAAPASFAQTDGAHAYVLIGGARQYTAFLDVRSIKRVGAVMTAEMLMAPSEPAAIGAGTVDYLVTTMEFDCAKHMDRVIHYRAVAAGGQVLAEKDDPTNTATAADANDKDANLVYGMVCHGAASTNATFTDAPSAVAYARRK